MFIPFMAIKLDNTDLRIIDVLNENSRLSTHKIAKKINIPVTTVYNRLKRLEREKVIKRYSVVLDHQKMGKAITTYVLVSFDIKVLREEITLAEVGKRLSKIKGVEGVSYITGRYDIILTIRIKDMAELNDLILHRLIKIPGIGSTETFTVTEEVKQ
jgi:Lrp/AsnC family leucine-responsive transcriptional regulator